ncbi:S-4TM family putative pore-forming effector [Bacillus timonensis]|uniref:S-4TM family putative pore-forming effector n=1 Tax=Bacillus timonensis TaxID=1033734 RepID=UPI0002889E3D|nr:S-4TM family putative pore-forming effector [Bacillus timonensis]
MLERQNMDKNILLLKSMRHIYNVAKKYYAARMVVAILLPIASIVFTLFNRYGITTDLSSIFSVLGFIWLPIFYYLQQKELNYIEKGAKIQEEFDTNVFNLPWNKALVGNRVTPEEIQEAANNFHEDETYLYNWYGGLKSKHYFINILLSQRSNLMWAVSLKQNFSYFILIVSLIYLVLTVFFASMLDMPLQIYLLVFLFPSTSILLYAVSTWWELTKQSMKIRELGEEVRVDCEKFALGERNIDMYLCRQYQDAVFVYNRKNAVLIPNKLYWMRRKKDDKKMIEVNQKLSEESNTIDVS